MAGGLLALGFVALINMFTTLPIGRSSESLTEVLTRLVKEGQITSASGLNWYLARVALETSVGMMLLIAAGLLIANKDRIGVTFSYWSLLLSLTTVDLLVFYFDQFSAIITASIQFTLLVLTIYYRQKFLQEGQLANRSSNWPEETHL
jgi:hypothetical protein